MSSRSTPPFGEARCREILEVGPGATLEEIRQAHAFLKGLYAPGSTTLGVPPMDEFDPEVQAGILEDIEVAFQELSRSLGLTAAPLHPVPPGPQDPEAILDGPALRRMREAEGFTLEHMSQETHVRLAYLEALEEERFQDLPSAAVIVRGYFTACMATLGLPPEPSVSAYLKRYTLRQGERPNPGR